MDATQQLLARIGGRFLMVGGTGLALVTWSERFVGPLIDAEVVLEPVPARVVHLVSFLAILLIPLGLAALALVLRAAGRAVVMACAAIGLGFVLGALPHTVLDFGAIPTVFQRLPEEQARELVDGFYAIIGPLAGLGMLCLLAGLLTLAFLGLVRQAVPRPLAWASLAALPGMIALGVLGRALPDVPVPHDPVALDLVVAFYGWYLLRRTAGVPAQPLRV